jgi:hypothetical protein
MRQVGAMAWRRVTEGGAADRGPKITRSKVRYLDEPDQYFETTPLFITMNPQTGRASKYPT